MQEDKEKKMTKDVVVSLKGLQLAPDQQSDAVEVIAPGEYYIRNNKFRTRFALSCWLVLIKYSIFKLSSVDASRGNTRSHLEHDG